MRSPKPPRKNAEGREVKMTKKETAILQNTCLTALLRWEEALEEDMDDEEMIYYEGSYKVTRYLCKAFGVPYPVSTFESKENDGE